RFSRDWSSDVCSSDLTTRIVHEEDIRPLVSNQGMKHLLIRSAVYLPAMLLVFASGDMNMLIIPIMIIFVCAEPRRGTQMNQVIEIGRASCRERAWRSG